MTKSIFAALLLLPAVAFAAPSSAGITAGSAEIVGGYFSTFVTPDVTLDLKAGVALASAGATAHIPMAAYWSLLVNGSGGYAYNGVHSDWPAHKGWHLGAMAGVGFEKTLDIRLLGGVITGPLTQDGSWGVWPMINFMVGWIF